MTSNTEKWDLPLSMSNLALSLPSSTILPGRDNLKNHISRPGYSHSTQRQNWHRRSRVFMNEPEEVGLGVELEIGSVDVKVKLWSSGVRHADVEDKVLGILAQVKCRSNHDDYWYAADLWRPWQGESSLTLQHIGLHSNGVLRAGGINNGLPDYSMPPCGWLN